MSAPHAQVERADFDRYMVPNYAPVAFTPMRGEGSCVWDQNGRELIDFAGGIAVTSLGHTHPALTKALAKQAQRIWHAFSVFTNEPALCLARKLVDATFAERVSLVNSSVKANEAAFKLARRYANDVYGPQKYKIIATSNSFHGHTLFTVSVGGQPKYSDGFGPRFEGITHAPHNDLEALKAAIPDKTCAVVLEPIQGKGGVLPAQQAYLEGARKLCDEHNALLVSDEVQSGMGRAGKLLAYMHYGVAPDILSSAESLGDGFPIGATLITGEIARHLSVGIHGTTYGGNPLASAVAEMVLDVINTPEVLDDVKAKHERFKSRLQKIGQEHGIFGEICGIGLPIGAALIDEWKGKARDVFNAAEKEMVIVFQASLDMVRFAPSPVIDDAEIDEGLERFEHAVAKPVRD